MIHKLRRRFILIAMASFFSVLPLLLVSQNAATRMNTYADLDARLPRLAERWSGPPQGMLAITPDDMRRWIDMNDAGLMSETSYFIFDGYMTLDVRQSQTELLSFALGEDANEVMRSILGGTRDFGNVGHYRWYCAQRADPYKIVFLRCDSEFSAMDSLLNSSLLIGAGVFALVFLLVTVLSKEAMRPYEENIRNQKRFISNASHELKTPLGVIVSDIDMQKLESGPSEWLENAQVQADHLSLLIDQLTSYTLLDEKRQHTSEVPVDLSALTEGLVGEFRPLSAANGQELTCEITPDVTVRGSGDAFRTLLSVLLENAVKYTPAGGAIRVCVRREKRAVLEVSNSCTALDTERLDRLFERFYRSPEHRADFGGSGLGLAIAQEITELYGGSIRAYYPEDGFIAFTAELPLAGGGIA